MGASNTSEITRTGSAESLPSRMLCRIARQFDPLPEPRIAILTIPYFGEQPARRVAWRERNDLDLSAAILQHAPLFRVQSLRSVIPTFDIDGRLGCPQKLDRAHLRKNRDVIDALERGQHLGTVVFVVQGAAFAFKFVHGDIAIYSHR